MVQKQQNKVLISREDFLSSVLDLYNSIRNFEEATSSFDDNGEIDLSKIKKILTDRKEQSDYGADNIKSMEIIAAFIRSTLQYYKGEQLSFIIPDEPDDDFFTRDDGYVNLANRIEPLNNELKSIEEKIYFLIHLIPSHNKKRLRMLLRAISGLFKSIIRKDTEDIELNIQNIHYITANKESYFLINEIGQMVREIHNSIEDFSASVPLDQVDSTITEEMPDAIEKLHLVIQRMESAANSTLDDAEELLDQNKQEQDSDNELIEITEELSKKLIALKAKHPDSNSEFDEILEAVNSKISIGLQQRRTQLASDEKLYFNIISNQSFQDLTGQTLKKIIAFIEELENNLLNILERYSAKTTGGKNGKSQSEEKSRISPLVGSQSDEGLVLEGPQDNKTDISEPKKQADIDSMLADFGF